MPEALAVAPELFAAGDIGAEAAALGTSADLFAGAADVGAEAALGAGAADAAALAAAGLPTDLTAGAAAANFPAQTAMAENAIAGATQLGGQAISPLGIDAGTQAPGVLQDVQTLDVGTRGLGANQLQSAVDLTSSVGGGGATDPFTLSQGMETLNAQPPGAEAMQTPGGAGTLTGDASTGFTDTANLPANALGQTTVPGAAGPTPDITTGTGQGLGQFPSSNAPGMADLQTQARLEQGGGPAPGISTGGGQTITTTTGRGGGGGLFSNFPGAGSGIGQLAALAPLAIAGLSGPPKLPTAGRAAFGGAESQLAQGQALTQAGLENRISPEQAAQLKTQQAQLQSMLFQQLANENPGGDPRQDSRWVQGIQAIDDALAKQYAAFVQQEIQNGLALQQLADPTLVQLASEQDQLARERDQAAFNAALASSLAFGGGGGGQTTTTTISPGVPA